MFFQTSGIRPLQPGQDRWQSGNQPTGTRGPKIQIDESIRSFSPSGETATRKISAVFFAPLKVLALGTAAPILLCANTAWATPTAVQSAFTDQVTSSGSISATFSGPNTAGDCIVISVGWANAPGVPISSVTDSQGNTYNLGIGPTSTVNRAMYYATNIGSHAAGSVVQVTFTSASGAAHLRIAEFSGVSGGAVLDGGAGRQITSSTPDSGPITTRSNGDLLVCAFWGGAGGTPTPGTGFTPLATDRWDAGMEYQVAGSAGSYDGTWNLGSSVQSEVQMIALTAANATPPPTSGPVTAIQSAFTDQGTSSSSISATFSGPNTAGDCIVISVGWANAPGVPISSVTDSQGNTYNLAIGPTSTVLRAMYYATNIGGHAAGNVVQVTFASAGGAAHLRIAEFSGVSGVLDGAAGRESTSATPDSGPITTTSNGDLLVCAFWGAGNVTPTPGTGFAPLVTDRWDAGMEYRVAGSAGSYDGTWNLSSSVQSQVQMIALTATTPTATPAPTPAPTGSSGLTLAWNADTPTSNPGTNPVGYRLHIGPSSGDYTQTQDVGNTTSGTVSNLTSGSTYFFAVTAYNAAGVDSPYSNEVAYTIP